VACIFNLKMHTIEQYLQMLGNNFIRELEMPSDYLYSARIQTALERHRWSILQSGMLGWILLRRLAPKRVF
jgi:hypothetical protein